MPMGHKAHAGSACIKDSWCRQVRDVRGSGAGDEAKRRNRTALLTILNTPRAVWCMVSEAPVSQRRSAEVMEDGADHRLGNGVYGESGHGVWVRNGVDFAA